MSELERPIVPFGPIEPGNDIEEQDEAGMLLAALDELRARVASPVLRACLEEARSDIAHLAGTGDGYTIPPPRELGDEEAAA